MEVRSGGQSIIKTSYFIGDQETSRADVIIMASAGLRRVGFLRTFWRAGTVIARVRSLGNEFLPPVGRHNPPRRVIPLSSDAGRAHTLSEVASMAGIAVFGAIIHSTPRRA